MEQFLRERPTTTLADVMKSFAKRARSVTCLCGDVDVRLLGRDPKIIFGPAGNKVEAAVTRPALENVAILLNVPTAFLLRVPVELRQNILTTLFAQSAASAITIEYGDEGIESIQESTVRSVPSKRIVEIAQRIIDEHALVIDYWDTPKEFWLDVVVPGIDYKGKGVGGDKKVGDYTLGGLRFGRTKDKRNLVPWCQEFFYRLACTNGFECQDPGERIQGQGTTPEKQLSQLESIAFRKFARIENTIRAYYDMRNRVVGDKVDRMVHRIAGEEKIPDRIRTRLLDVLPAEMPDDPTEFDVANLFTNLANEPTIRNQARVRRGLSVIGGNMVLDHSARCGHCQSRLVNA